MSGTAEVEAFLSEIGLESCIQAVVHNGFYTSMEALRNAQYEELVDSGVRPVHAKLIISNLGSKQEYGSLSSGASAIDGGDKVASFLRSVGLEHCSAQLDAAGLTTLELLGEATMQDLLTAGLKPVHARLILSNLETASTTGISMTPANRRLASLDSEENGGLLDKKAPPPGRRLRIYGCALVLLLVMLGLFRGGQSSAPVPPPPTTELNPPSGLPKLQGQARGWGRSAEQGSSEQARPAAKERSGRARGSAAFVGSGRGGGGAREVGARSAHRGGGQRG